MSNRAWSLGGPHANGTAPPRVARMHPLVECRHRSCLSTMMPTHLLGKQVWPVRQANNSLQLVATLSCKTRCQPS